MNLVCLPCANREPSALFKISTDRKASVLPLFKVLASIIMSCPTLAAFMNEMDRSTLTPATGSCEVRRAHVETASTSVEVIPPCRVPALFWCSSRTVISHRAHPSPADTTRNWNEQFIIHLKEMYKLPPLIKETFLFFMITYLKGLETSPNMSLKVLSDSKTISNTCNNILGHFFMSFHLVQLWYKLNCLIVQMWNKLLYMFILSKAINKLKQILSSEQTTTDNLKLSGHIFSKIKSC